MATTKYRTYHLTVDLDILIKEKSLVAHNPDSIEAAVRHALKLYLPTTGFTSAGYKFNENTIHADASLHWNKRKEEANAE